MTDSTGTTRPSLRLDGDTATYTDQHGREFTATGLSISEGDRVGVEGAQDGMWVTVERDGEERQRHPLRHGDDPHFTELKAMMMYPNPFLPPAVGSKEVQA